MSAKGTLMRRIARIPSSWVVDVLVALVLTVGALIDAAAQPHDRASAFAITACALLTGSVALRRWNPVVSTPLAVTGFAAFVWASGYDGDGAFEVVAIALNFYLLGQRQRTRRGLGVAAAVFAYWLAGVAVVTYSVPGGSVGGVLGPWVVLAGLPFALGRTLETRRMLISELEASRARLEGEHDIRARRAAVEERTRMARELHDVIAHCVSVIVVQTGGARRVAQHDRASAETALAVVERSGREALAELRRLVGVVRRDGDRPAGAAASLLSQLDPLLERMRAGGLGIELHVTGEPSALPPGVELVAYRILQEALTNVRKHAGRVQARVEVGFGARELELRVIDTGKRRRVDGASDRLAGHGLVGMRERVALYGGSLSAGERTGGGFEVHARVPLDGALPELEAVGAVAPADIGLLADDARSARPWLDPALAAIALVALEAAVLTSAHQRGPLALNAIAVALVASVVVWRRRVPLLLLLVAGAYSVASDSQLTPLGGSSMIGAALLIVPLYSVAAWEGRRRAIVGLALALVGAGAGNLGSAGNLAGAVFVVVAAWGAGRALRARRLLTAELAHASARLAAEQDDRARLAVAGERNRVARELHAGIASRVEEIVVQASAARSLLEDQPVAADLAMGSIEDGGRQTLTEMRGILGVLRHPRAGAERGPQPGVEQIYALIRDARDGGQQVELRVDGEPGTLPASVDFGVYRILEEGLSSARRQPAGAVSVLVRFGLHALELELTAGCRGPSQWPTDAMRERIDLCGGHLAVDTGETTAGWNLRATLPRGCELAQVAG